MSRPLLTPLEMLILCAAEVASSELLWMPEISHALEGGHQCQCWLPCMQETQTKPEGQIHFFPIIFNSEQLYNTMVERCGPSQTSAPKE